MKSLLTPLIGWGWWGILRTALPTQFIVESFCLTSRIRQTEWIISDLVFVTERWAIKSFRFLNFCFCLLLIKQYQTSEPAKQGGIDQRWWLKSTTQLSTGDFSWTPSVVLLIFGQNGALSKLEREIWKTWQTLWKWGYQRAVSKLNST